VTRRSSSTREPKPRNRGASQRPRVVATVRAPIEASTDHRAGERCLLQRLDSGEHRIVLLDKSCAGYAISNADIEGEFATLLYLGEGSDRDEYTVPVAAWYEVQTMAAAEPVRRSKAMSQRGVSLAPAG
jgi:hypothetical protein